MSNNDSYIKLDEAIDIMTLIKVHRIFLNNPTYLLKKIIGILYNSLTKCNIDLTTSIEICYINEIDNNLKYIMDVCDNCIKFPNDINKYCHCIDKLKRIIYLAKLHNIPIIIDPYDDEYEKKYIKSENFDNENYLNLTSLITDVKNLEDPEIQNMFCFRSYADFINMYSYIDNNNRLIICFRQTSSFNDWKHNLRFTPDNFVDIINYANTYLCTPLFDKTKYEKITTHHGYTQGFLMENDNSEKDISDKYIQEDRNLIQFLLNIVEKYNKTTIKQKEIIIMGHSLGGGLSYLASMFIKEYLNIKKYDITVTVIITGAPTIGNDEFTKLYIENFVNNDKSRLYKLVRYGDLVISTVPNWFGYVPINHEIVTNLTYTKWEINKDPIGRGVFYILKYGGRTMLSLMNNMTWSYFTSLIDNHESLCYCIDFKKYIEQIKKI